MLLACSKAMSTTVVSQSEKAGVRWAFDVGAWKPSEEQWLTASSIVQSEELERIRRFVYTKDSKASIIGRLLMRKLVVEVLGIRQSRVKFARTEHGKPYLITDDDDDDDDDRSGPVAAPAALSFNVSHQGSYCVLAAERDRPVGVDVTRMLYSGGKPVPEFFRLMRRQFTPKEWCVIGGPSDEKDRLRLFYRHWALKESYVKALGVGIGFDLQRVGFVVKTDLSDGDTVVTDTTLEVDRRPATNWTFEESLLDDEHCVAVALATRSAITAVRPLQRFQLVNFDEVVRELEPVRPSDASLWTEFVAKSESPC